MKKLFLLLTTTTIISNLFTLSNQLDITYPECGKATPTILTDCTYYHTAENACCFSTITVNNVKTGISTTQRCSKIEMKKVMFSPYYNTFQIIADEITYVHNCGDKTASELLKTNYVCSPKSINIDNLNSCAMTAVSTGGSRCCLVKGSTSNTCMWSEPNKNINYNYNGLTVQCNSDTAFTNIYDNTDYNNIVREKAECGSAKPVVSSDCNSASTATMSCCLKTSQYLQNPVTKACTQLEKKRAILGSYYTSYTTNSYPSRLLNIQMECGSDATLQDSFNSYSCGANKKPNTFSDCSGSSDLPIGLTCCLVEGRNNNICIWSEKGSTLNFNYLGIKMTCNNSSNYTMITNEEQYNTLVKIGLNDSSSGRLAWNINICIIILISLLIY